ncbi:hypothetical protein NC651_020521 [Populus alba x Populus x berolinensis]|nr:hypothetical protein NC651_020521 [Populus alba x Populus x berolinensis]
MMQGGPETATTLGFHSKISHLSIADIGFLTEKTNGYLTGGKHRVLNLPTLYLDLASWKVQFLGACDHLNP